MNVESTKYVLQNHNNVFSWLSLRTPTWQNDSVFILFQFALAEQVPTYLYIWINQYPKITPKSLLSSAKGLNFSKYVIQITTTFLLSTRQINVYM